LRLAGRVGRHSQKSLSTANQHRNLRGGGSEILYIGCDLIRVIVADPNAQTLRALTTMLREQPDVSLAGEAAGAEELLSLAGTRRADVILVDRLLSGCPIATLLAKLHARIPRPFVIVMGSQPAHSRWALNAGADAFVSKGDDPEWLLESIHSYVNKE